MKKVLVLLALLSSVSFGKTYMKKDVEVKNSVTYDIKTNEPINGELVEYYENGQKLSVNEYKKGIATGSYKEYYETGELKGNVTFTEGTEPTGRGIEYRKDGKKLHEVYYKNGKVTKMVEHYDSGERKQLIKYNDKGDVIKLVEYDESGKEKPKKVDKDGNQVIEL